MAKKNNKTVFYTIHDSYRKKPLLTCTLDPDKGRDAWEKIVSDEMQNSAKKFELKQIGNRNHYKLIKRSYAHGECEEVVAVITGNQSIQLCEERYYIETENRSSLNIMRFEYDYKNDPDYADMEWEE